MGCFFFFSLQKRSFFDRFIYHIGLNTSKNLHIRKKCSNFAADFVKCSLDKCCCK